MKPVLLCFLGAALAARTCVADTTRPLLPLPAGTTAKLVTPPVDPDHFTFIVTGDNRSAGRGIPMPPTATQIFAEMRLLQPAFTLWTGDAIYGSDDTVPEADAEYDAFLSLAAQSATPIYNAPGNHEIFNRPELAALYEKKMGLLYGSFDYGNTHVIAIDTEEVNEKTSLGKAQMDWLKQDLAANKKAKNLMVFSHHPLFPKEAKEGFTDTAFRDELHQLFVASGVKNVFSGHEHLYFKSVHDGITYWISGGAGAPASTDPEDGGFQHFLLLEVNGDRLTATTLAPWRLFSSLETNPPPGTAAGTLVNYDAEALPLIMELPMTGLPTDLTATAVSTYKGKSLPLDAVIVPSRTPGTISVRVTVPKGRAVRVTLAPKATATK